MSRPKLVGINHIALEVGDIKQALKFYGNLFAFELRGKTAHTAFIDMGDQFLALSKTDETSEDSHRHFGLVVDDKNRVRTILEQNGVEILPGPSLNFRDPWGNRIQVVDYKDVQFTKSPEILKAMGFEKLKKSEQARRELKEKGLIESYSKT